MPATPPSLNPVEIALQSIDLDPGAPLQFHCFPSFAHTSTPPSLGALKLVCEELQPALDMRPALADAARPPDPELVDRLFLSRDADAPDAAMTRHLTLAAQHLQDGHATLDLTHFIQAYALIKTAYLGLTSPRCYLITAPPPGLISLDIRLRGGPDLRVQQLLTGYEAAFLRGLAQIVSSGGARGTTLDGTHLATVYLVSDLLMAVMTDTPFVIDADRLRILHTSSFPSSRSALKALAQIQPVMVDLAKRGLLRPPRVLSQAQAPEENRLASAWQDVAVPPDLAHLLPGPCRTAGERVDGVTQTQTQTQTQDLDEARPLRCVLDLGSRVTQTLDRQSGTIDLCWPDRDSPDPHTARLRVDALPIDADPAARARQDRQIRQLDDFCRVHFARADTEQPWRLFPPEIRQEGRRIIVGELTVAEEIAGVWTPDTEAVRHALDVLGWREAVPIVTAEPETTLPPLNETAPRHPMPELQLILQMEDDAIITQGCAELQGKHSHNSVWVRLDQDGDTTIVGGASLLGAVSPEVALKLVVSGHGGREGRKSADRMALSGYAPPALAERLSDGLESLGLTARARHVTLFSCMLETAALGNGFAADFLRAADRLCLTAPDATVTAYVDAVGGGDRRFTVSHLGAAPRYHAPGKTRVFQIDPVTREISSRDKYPANSGTPLPTKTWHRPFAHTPRIAEDDALAPSDRDGSDLRSMENTVDTDFARDSAFVPLGTVPLSGWPR